jgi:hypothetical protein
MPTGTELFESLDYLEFLCPLSVLLANFLEPFTEDVAMAFHALAPGR